MELAPSEAYSEQSLAARRIRFYDKAAGHAPIRQDELEVHPVSTLPCRLGKETITYAAYFRDFNDSFIKAAADVASASVRMSGGATRITFLASGPRRWMPSRPLPR
jgi:hypothetical protein